MIISIDPPSDLKVSDLDLKYSDDINNNQLPNFSIRDYVLGKRSKDISCNWPFSPTSLQLCLKHGVKNLLPPFQSLDSLRNYPSLTRCSLENRLTDEKLIKSFDVELKTDQSCLNDKIALESQFRLQRQTKSKGKDKPQKPENISSVRAIIKKGRFVTKVNSSVEHAAPSFETITSKVCPVCKIFSSSSNTTLNAHIDQCLTGEGTMKWTENHNVEVKYRVKPRKMRLMVEIYKTAPKCTIEELDRRNGTSWATSSSFHAQEFQFQDKEPKIRTTFNPKVTNNEGDVYIDTDGTKVRILSVPRAVSSDNHGGRKLPKEVKRSKITMGKKKKDIFKKHQKYLKLSSNARNLFSPKPQVMSGQEDDVAMKVADLGIIRPPWACSKRTGLSKKCSGKNRKVELKYPETKDLISKSVNGSSQDSLKDQTVNQDDFHDRESVRNETLLSNVVPTLIGLSTSFDPEFSKQDCDDLHQDQICSTTRAPNDVEITIPGPPGSLLPASPGGEMVSEEGIQAVMVLSPSENHHHHDHSMDRDSLTNSPVSTVSNSRSTSVQDDTCKKPFFIADMGFTEKVLTDNSFENDHQPCCFSRKQLIESNRSIPIGFNFKSELFSAATETTSFPTNKNLAISSVSDHSPASSPSKPVLRLMGKNLTVVNTDEDEFRHPQQNKIFSQYQNGFHRPLNMRGEADLMPIHGGFMGSIARYGDGGPYLAPTMPHMRSHHDHNNFFQRNQGLMNPTNTMFSSYGNNGDLCKWNTGSPSMSHLQSSTSYYPPNYP